VINSIIGTIKKPAIVANVIGLRNILKSYLNTTANMLLRDEIRCGSGAGSMAETLCSELNTMLEERLKSILKFLKGSYAKSVTFYLQQRETTEITASLLRLNLFADNVMSILARGNYQTTFKRGSI